MVSIRIDLDCIFLKGDSLIHSADLHTPSLKSALTDGKQNGTERDHETVVVCLLTMLIQICQCIKHSGSHHGNIVRLFSVFQSCHIPADAVCRFQKAFNQRIFRSGIYPQIILSFFQCDQHIYLQLMRLSHSLRKERAFIGGPKTSTGVLLSYRLALRLSCFALKLEHLNGLRKDELTIHTLRTTEAYLAVDSK